MCLPFLHGLTQVAVMEQLRRASERKRIRQAPSLQRRHACCAHVSSLQDKCGEKESYFYAVTMQTPKAITKNTTMTTHCTQSH
ncbi:hypothetical protein VTL71DRAFT_11665 [Oculimacula yallundae]|uniref:Secreted protein n=1 Tax=Oculimacula yallundae TaxID=86028 RepID=A0ABR4CQQ2_9HELO